MTALNSVVLPVEETVIIVGTIVFKKEDLYNSAHPVIFSMVLAELKHYLPITPVPLQAWAYPLVSSRLRLPDFKTIVT